MALPDIDALNAQFGGGDRPRFTLSPGGLALAQLAAAGAEATVALQGGQVLGYTPPSGRPVLWASRLAYDAPGKAIRGGIPICWPWFGPHPSEPSLPQHGFARVAAWYALASGPASLRLGLSDNATTRALWPYRFSLDLLITLGAGLEVALTMRNTGDAPFTCSGALHSYFAVSDVAAVSVGGLNGTRYLDKVGGGEQAQQGPVTICGEVDRIYLRTTAPCVIDDPAWDRRIVIEKLGSHTTVVWNPWVEKAARMADFADDEYPQMLCVETANAADDSITLAPGAAHRLRATIRSETSAE